ncbi:MAG: ATP-binding cassette domain-containing protein [Spartobacteria bacterium]|nr:ATP-binding cassette domain-containing protein [Spartobacteria bacterium]
MNSEDSIQLRQISLEVDGRTVLNKLNLEILPGQIHALTGRKGAGKSHLAHILCGMTAPTSGRLDIGNRSYRQLNQTLARRLGIVMVSYPLQLHGNLTVAENILFYTQLNRTFIFESEAKRREKTEKYLEEIGAEISAKALVQDLSSSKRTLIAILKAMQINPRLIILNQVLRLLTPEDIHLLLPLLQRICARGGSVLWITQNFDELNLWAQRVSVLAKGTIILTDSTDAVDRLSLIKLSYAQFDKNHSHSSHDFYQILKYNEAILRNLPMFLIVVNEQMQVKMVNNFGQKYLRSASEALQNVPISDILQGNERILQLITNTMEEGNEVRSIQAELSLYGQKFRVNVSVQPIMESARLIGGIILLEDISESEELRRKLTLADKLSSIGLLGAGVAHEINNPLEIMASSLRYLKKRAQDAEQQEVFAELDEEIRHIRDIVGNLVTFSAEAESALASLEIGDLLQAIIKLVRYNVREKNIKIILEKAKEPLFVQGHPGELKQVVLNLIKNSVEAMDCGGELVIVLDRLNEDNQSWIRLRFQDTGTGIESDNIDEVFLPFYSTKKRKGQSMGLGLSITIGIIQQHKGTISVRNRDRGGCEFQVLLPEAPQA